MNFTYQSFANKVFFGQNAQVAFEQAAQGQAKRVFLIASRRNQDLIGFLQASPLFEITHLFDEIAQHVPLELVEKAALQVQQEHTNLILSIGGGSAIGLAKALALRFHIPIWAVPTTYAGSEMTNIYGISEGGKKTVGRADVVLPQVVIYDPHLTAALPLPIAIKSATNAMAHLVEGVYAVQNNPISYQQSLMGIKAILQGYETVKSSQSLTKEANEAFLLGTYLGGKSLCELPMALHHKAAHVLGGNFNLDHASVHTVLLPFILDFQWESLPAQIQEDFRTAFGHASPAAFLLHTLQALQIPTSLQAIGFKERDIDDAAAQIAALKFENPAPINVESLSAMLKKACRGDF